MMYHSSFRRLGVLIATLVSLAVVTACSDSDSAAPRPTGPSSSSTSTSTTATDSNVEIPAPPPVAEWTSATHPDTGVSFALPGEAKVETRAGNAEGTTPTATAYTVEVDGGLVLWVGFTEAATADYSPEGLNFVADSLFEMLPKAGTDNAASAYRQHTTVNGHPALDCRLSFTARNGKETIWFARIIGDGTRAVQVQSIGSSAPDDSDSVTTVIEQYHQLLIDSVRLP